MAGCDDDAVADDEDDEAKPSARSPRHRGRVVLLRPMCPRTILDLY